MMRCCAVKAARSFFSHVPSTTHRVQRATFTWIQNRPSACIIFFARSNALSSAGRIIGCEVSISIAKSPANSYTVDRPVRDTVDSDSCIHLRPTLKNTRRSVSMATYEAADTNRCLPITRMHNCSRETWKRRSDKVTCDALAEFSSQTPRSLR